MRYLICKNLTKHDVTQSKLLQHTLTCNAACRSKNKSHCYFYSCLNLRKKKQVTKVLKALDTYMHMCTSREHAMYMYMHCTCASTCKVLRFMHPLKHAKLFARHHTSHSFASFTHSLHSSKTRHSKSILFTSRQHSSFPVLVFCVKRKRQHSATG